jgi:hypothetical protein
MGFETVRTKLQEARSFLNLMRDQEQRAFGDRSQFDNNLSAFLSAGRSVDYRLKHEYKATYPTWRTKWNASHPFEDRPLESMHTRRANEVHASGSGRAVKSKEIKVGSGGSYSDKSGTLEVMGSPTPLTGVDTGATISMPHYVFDIDGVAKPVTEACAEYLTVLEQMVAQFEAETSR